MIYIYLYKTGHSKQCNSECFACFFSCVPNPFDGTVIIKVEDQSSDQRLSLLVKLDMKGSSTSVLSTNGKAARTPLASEEGTSKSEGSFWLVQFSYGSRATWQKYKFLRTAAWLGVSHATCWRTTSVVSRPGVGLYVLRLVVLLLDGNLLASKHKDSTASL